MSSITTIERVSTVKGGEPGGEDLSDVHSLVARKLLLGTAFGDLLLYLLFRRDIPHRDYAMCRAGLVSLILFTTIESSNERPQLTSKRFRRIFGALSLLEVVFTLAIPWLIILEGLFNTSERAKNGHLLAAHLFIFQAQIAGEAIIMLAGDHRRWLIFPYTCVANAYRCVTLGTWVKRVMNEDVIEPRDFILCWIATCLWIYSSFVFIPKVWYPVIAKQKSN